jgi:hypothetical protein
MLSKGYSNFFNNEKIKTQFIFNFKKLKNNFLSNTAISNRGRARISIRRSPVHKAVRIAVGGAVKIWYIDKAAPIPGGNPKLSPNYN